jgi:hypothetical protein
MPDLDAAKPLLDRQLAEEIIEASGLTTTRLGLRFDRVVVRILTDLRRFADGATPAGLTVLLTLTAPIRTPAKTAGALEQEIGALLVDGAVGADRSATLYGNGVRLRLIRSASRRKLIGFVHNPDSDATHLLDLAEHWLSAVPSIAPSPGGSDFTHEGKSKGGHKRS